MKTDDLIAILARGEGAVKRGVLWRHYAAALGWGVLGAAILLILALGVRPDLADAARLPMFWIKFVFVAAVAAAGLVIAKRLSFPGGRLGLSPVALAAPIIVMWALAALALSGSAVDRMDLVLGQTWYSCPGFIATLSTPAFIAAIWAMRGLAPTNLRLAGAAAGVFAAGVGATVYSFHCTEMAAPFLGIWYVLGMSIPAIIGAILGPRLLRW